MATAFLATVHLLLPLGIKSEDEAADAISGLLTEGGIYEDAILDWSYPSRAGRYVYARPVEIPDDYDRDEGDLSAIAGDDEAGRLREVNAALVEATEQVVGLLERLLGMVPGEELDLHDVRATVIERQAFYRTALAKARKEG